MNKKLHDAIRTCQWLIPALLGFFGVLDEVFEWGVLDPVNKIAMAFVAFIGIVAQNSSRAFFGENVIKPKEFTQEEIDAIMNGEDEDE